MFIINCAKRSKCLITWTKKSVQCNLTIHKPASGSLICSGKSGQVIDHSSKKCWEDKKSNSHLNVRRQSEEQTHENVADLPNNTKPRLPLLTNFSHSCLVFHFPARANGTCTREKASPLAVPQSCQNSEGFARYLPRLLTVQATIALLNYFFILCIYLPFILYNFP